MKKDAKIFVAGGTGLMGSAIVRRLQGEGYTNVITRTKEQLDLRIQEDVADFFYMQRPQYVFLVAATVGGIHANNTRRAEFIFDNLMIQSNVIHQSYLCGVKKLLFTGSSCIYPKFSEQPIKEEYLLTGILEPTNEPYAIAKIAGIKMCQAYNSQYGCNFITTNPTNLYGFQNENFDLKGGHVIPSLIRKFIVAKRDNSNVMIWGSGLPRREFLYCDDAADGCVFLMENYNETDVINLGTGVDHELNEVAKMIAELIEFKGEIIHDLSQPDGMKNRKMDVSKINSLGWKAKTELRDGLKITIENIYKSGKHLEW